MLRFVTADHLEELLNIALSRRLREHIDDVCERYIARLDATEYVPHGTEALANSNPDQCSC